MILLNQQNLKHIAQQGIEVPNYSRSVNEVTHRICHIGVGGFHRAHQAVYLHDLLQAGKAQGWGICGIGLMPHDVPMHNMLKKQDCLYSVWALGKQGQQIKVVGSIVDHLDASQNKQAAIQMMADAGTRIVSMTITEKGYCLAKDGKLDAQHPAIVSDLAKPDQPESAIGVITRALDLRRQNNLPAFTVMSCDNLVENGHQARKAIVSFARLLNPQLADWIAANASFPLSMVDRITPVPNAEVIAARCAQWGIQDDGLLVCEDWLQWVLEDQFAQGRPEFEAVGVQITADVKPYENMKIGLLNGSHSALSYHGLLQGMVRVDEACSNPAIQTWLLQYMKQIESTLAPVEGINFDEYEQALIERFSNPNIQDHLTRLAEDGSAKFQQAFLPALINRMDGKQEIASLASAIAYWVVYLAKLDGDEQAAKLYKDPLKPELIKLALSGLQQAQLGPFVNKAFGLEGQYQEQFAEQVLQHAQPLYCATSNAPLN